MGDPPSTSQPCLSTADQHRSLGRGCCGRAPRPVPHGRAGPSPSSRVLEPHREKRPPAWSRPEVPPLRIPSRPVGPSLRAYPDTRAPVIPPPGYLRPDTYSGWALHAGRNTGNVGFVRRPGQMGPGLELPRGARPVQE